MSYIEKMDGYLDSLKIGKSPVVDSWFMMSSPTPILAVVALYLTFVRLGPKFMKNKPAFQMNKLIMYYNGFQVALSVVLCYKAFSLNLFTDGIPYAGCRYPSTTLNPQLLDLGWWYFIAKFTELLDTVFFILRKKDNQVTFLHVYHHGIMALYSWSYLKFEAGGQGAILALLNSFVHIVMYSYYFLAGLGPKLQKYLWWKKYVTSLQMIQFIFMLAYCVITHLSPKCQYSPRYTYFICSNVVAFLFLFYNFYYQSYKANKARKQSLKYTNGTVKNGNCTNGKVVNDQSTRDVISNFGNNTKNGNIHLRGTGKASGSHKDFEDLRK